MNQDRKREANNRNFAKFVINHTDKNEQDDVEFADEYKAEPISKDKR